MAEPRCGKGAPFKQTIDNIVRCCDGREGFGKDGTEPCEYRVPIETPPGMPKPLLNLRYHGCKYGEK